MIMQSKMKQLILFLLLLFSVNVYAETYSCVSKDTSQLIFSREGKQFKKTVSIDTDDRGFKESCKNSDTVFCKTGKSEDILSIVFENDLDSLPLNGSWWFIRNIEHHPTHISHPIDYFGRN